MLVFNTAQRWLSRLDVSSGRNPTAIRRVTIFLIRNRRNDLRFLKIESETHQSFLWRFIDLHV